MSITFPRLASLGAAAALAAALAPGLAGASARSHSAKVVPGKYSGMVRAAYAGGSAFDMSGSGTWSMTIDASGHVVGAATIAAHLGKFSDKAAGTSVTCLFSPPMEVRGPESFTGTFDGAFLNAVVSPHVVLVGGVPRMTCKVGGQTVSLPAAAAPKVPPITGAIHAKFADFLAMVTTKAGATSTVTIHGWTETFSVSSRP